VRFLADESCDFSVVRTLRAAGHDVVAIAELVAGSDDAIVMDLALRDSRVLLKEDKDFGQLVYAQSQQSSGVIFIVIRPRLEKVSRTLWSLSSRSLRQI
jgi:predicted nuclease of predicted toxin-antitoxin system